MSASLKYMLLGIALLLFGQASPYLLDLVYRYVVPVYFMGHLLGMLFPLIFPVAGLTMACIGFFKRETPAAQ